MKNCPYCKCGHAQLTGTPNSSVDIFDIAEGIKAAHESTQCNLCGVRLQWLPQRVNATYAVRCALEAAMSSFARSSI
jgi:hypothetical protein